LYPTLLAANNDGLEEFIILALFVPLVDGLDGIAALFALTEDETLHRNLNPVPPLVAIHGIISPNNGRQLPNSHLLRLCQ
jgi:hypothetical protein